MSEPCTTFTQRQGWFRRVELSLQEEDLFVRHRVGRNEYPQRIPLEYVNPYTCDATERRPALKIASIAAFIAAATLGVIAFTGEAGANQAWVYLGLGAAALAWAPLTIAYFLMVTDFVYLYDRRSGACIVSLVCDRPTRQEVDEFLERLMAAAGERYELSGEQPVSPGAYRTACEIEKSRTLLQAGVLDREAFETRKRALLRAFLIGALKRTDDEKEPLAEISQRQGLFKRCTYRIFPDRLERSQVGLGRRARTFRYMASVPEHPDKRALPSYGLAALAAIALYFTLGIIPAAAFIEPDESGFFMPRVLAAVSWSVLMLVGPFVVVWWLRRQPVYVFSYATARSAVHGAERTVLGWWLRDGRPSRSAVETFLKVMAKAHKDFQENNMPPGEIFARFQSLYDREILTEEELLDIHARLAKKPRARSVGTGWGITPSLN